VTNVLGGNVSFSVTAVGTAPLSYQWQQNGFSLPGQTASNLVLNAIADSAAGSYSVIVSNLAGSVTSSNATLTIMHPPVFSSQPTNLVVNLGGNATFSVSVNGATPFIYQWQKNNVNILGANNRQLILIGVTTNDAASYRVVVNNADGTATSSNATLTVIVPPAIISQPLSLTNNAGTTAIFAVTNTGSAATYRWYKNGTNLLNDGGKISGSTNSVLTITNVLGADSGTYDVVVSNAAGVVTSSNATLVVIDPIITNEPVSLTVNLGSPASFSVGAYGTSPHYQWYINGVGINGANASTYAIASAANSDQGSYTVVVTNIYGAVTNAPPATLTVISPPVITHQPSSRTNNAGTTATFTVTATGTAPTYQWYKNDVLLHDAGNISGSTTATLTIANVQDTDAASYKVYVANDIGNQTSSAATLTVIDPPIITQQPVGLTNAAGTTATFTVTATGTSPSYQWLKDGTNVLTDAGKISGSGTPTLTITNLLGADDGQYSVIVSNAAGVVISSNATLAVIDPYILVQPSNTTNSIGSTAVFNVTAIGTAPLTYQWQWEGYDLFDETNRTLTLDNISDSDAGSYTVIVANSYGSITSSPALLVTFPPLIITQPADFIAIIGQPASFSVDVNGQTPFSYQWQKDNVDITGATNRVYTIDATAYSDAGNYRVIVTNPLGTETSHYAALTVTDLPVLTMVLSNNIPVLTVRWFPDSLCAIDASTNLIDWTALVTNTVPFTFLDTNAPLYDSRFYRARGIP
jgi:hypothetical protein